MAQERKGELDGKALVCTWVDYDKYHHYYHFQDGEVFQYFINQDIPPEVVQDILGPYHTTVDRIKAKRFDLNRKTLRLSQGHGSTSDCQIIHPKEIAVGITNEMEEWKEELKELMKDNKI